MKAPLAAALCLLALFHVPAAGDAQDTVISIAGSELLDRPAQLQPASETTRELKQILAQDEYHAEGQVKRESWLTRLWNKLQALLNNKLSGSGAWGVALAILLLALVVFLVVRLAWQFATRARDGRAGSEKLDPRNQTTEQLLTAAADAVTRGDYRAAVRFRYLALLRSLNMPSTTVLTNSQVKRRLARNHPVLLGSFGRLVVCYEDAWYGGLRCHQDEYTLADRLARDIETIIAERNEDDTAQ